MDVFSVITLLGGLALFLFGMQTMSSSLEKMAGSKLESTLKSITASTAKSLLLGAGITMIIQSSSAVTVMLVGLVNSGIMGFSDTIGIIMGSNIGTTITAWLLATTGIESNNIFIKLLTPTGFAPILALIGILIIFISKKQKRKDIGTILLGFAILLFGMQFMSSAVAPLRDSESFTSILTAFKSPIIGVLFGTIFTAIIQSSSASVGILQALSTTGAISYGVAIPIILGQNIGTCVTAVISSIGANKNAKRVAAIHVTIKLIGTAVVLVLYYIFKSAVTSWFADKIIDPTGIAISHTVFNVFTTVLLLPFKNLLGKLAEKLVRSKPDAKETEALIDERLFLTPSFAIAECRNITSKMCTLASKTLFMSIDQFDNYDEQRAAEIVINEDMLDMYEDKLGGYLVKLSSKELTEENSGDIARLFNVIGEFERIGDHAVNLLQAAAEMREKNLRFSDRASDELRVLTKAISDILSTTSKAFTDELLDLAVKVEPLEQVVDMLIVEIRERHTVRLIEGSCTIQLGFVLSDILANYERVSDHCSNIAVDIIQSKSPTLDAHTYLNSVKSGDADFVRLFNQYKEDYALPKMKK